MQSSFADAAAALHPAPQSPQLVLPVAPPVSLYGSRVQEGQLGLKFMRVKANPWDTGVYLGWSAAVSRVAEGLQTALSTCSWV